MSGDILQYADQALAELPFIRNKRAPEAIRHPHCCHGDFRAADSELFLALHPNKSVIELPRAPMHTHDYVEVVYVRRGTLHQRIDGRTMCLPEGAILLLNANAYHEPWVETDSDIVVNLGIRPERIRRLLADMTEKSGAEVAPLVNALTGAARPGAPSFLHVRNGGCIDSLINEMFCEYHAGDAWAERVLLTDLMRLFIELGRYGGMEPADGGPQAAAEDIYEAVRRYIQNHFSSLTMEELSAHFAYSERQMRRILRAMSDCSLPELLNRIRIEKACEYIDRAHMPVEQLLASTGFSNTAYFYRVFREFTGMSVPDYRNRNRSCNS